MSETLSGATAAACRGCLAKATEFRPADGRHACSVG